eukprot:7527235-Prorocentrum_lima.AAC.1
MAVTSVCGSTGWSRKCNGPREGGWKGHGPRSVLPASVWTCGTGPIPGGDRLAGSSVRMQSPHGSTGCAVVGCADRERRMVAASGMA